MVSAVIAAVCPIIPDDPLVFITVARNPAACRRFAFSWFVASTPKHSLERTIPRTD